MQSARIIVGLLVVSFLLVGCEGGGDGTTTAPPTESKAAADMANEKMKSRLGPMDKAKAPASSPAAK